MRAFPLREPVFTSDISCTCSSLDVALIHQSDVSTMCSSTSSSFLTSDRDKTCLCSVNMYKPHFRKPCIPSWRKSSPRITMCGPVEPPPTEMRLLLRCPMTEAADTGLQSRRISVAFDLAGFTMACLTPILYESASPLTSIFWQSASARFNHSIRHIIHL